MPRDGVATVTGVDPASDMPEVELPAGSDPSQASRADFSDSTGTTISYDGTDLAAVTGAQSLTSTDIAITVLQRSCPSSWQKYPGVNAREPRRGAAPLRVFAQARPRNANAP